MVNFRKAVSFLVSHRRNKLKGTFSTDSFLVSFRKNSSSFFLEVGTGISPLKTNCAPFYSSSSSNYQKLLIHRRSIYEKDDDDQKVSEYSYEIKQLCDSGQILRAVDVLDDMVEMGCKPYVQTYINIIDGLLRQGREDYALQLFREMAFHRSILPDPATYDSLLHCLRILSRKDDISKMLKDMEDEGVFVNLRTFNIFVDAYCKEGRMEEAESLVKIMLERRIGPTVPTYRWLIDGYCLKGEMSKSREVFDSRMRYRGMVVKPNVDIYNSLLNGYCKVSKIEDAVLLFHEMMKNCVEHGAITYDNMGLFRFESRTPKKEFFDMVARPDECTFKIIMEGLCNNNRVDDAVSLFRSIGEKKLNSNIALYNALIYGAGKNGQFSVVRMLYNELALKGLEPNAMTYAAIHGFSQDLKTTDKMIL